MPAQTVARRSGTVTRQRILEAATQRFAQASYEHVGLRDIAADVGVDVALVHRAFGSKERLFEEAFKVAVQTEQLLSAEKSELGAVFAKAIYEPDLAMPPNAAALQIFAHSLSSPQAAEVLRSFTMQNLIEPLADRLDDLPLQRAALFVACLAGISILRDVLRVEPLRDDTKQQSEPLVARLLDSCLDDAPGSDPSSARRS